MREPHYDAVTHTLTAVFDVLGAEDAAALEGALARHGDEHDAGPLPASAGPVTLFIDASIVLCSNPQTCKTNGSWVGGSTTVLNLPNMTITEEFTVTPATNAPTP